ncbi:MAG: FAD:protein FMN transferase [Actinomycetota bacterium]
MAVETHRFPVMGTTAEVTVVDGHDRALAAAEVRLQELERLWSRFLDGSELAAINRAAGRPTVVSAETYRLIDQAVDAWRRTGGRFDPTLGTTMERAGYDRSLTDLDPTMPRAGTADLPAPTPVDVVLHPYASAVELPPDVRLDLGGIAKGAAADLVATELLDLDVAGCCVNIGGDLRVTGTPPRSSGWRIDLEHPGAAGPPITVALQRGAVCTSTSALRRWQGAHGPQHHLRDPVTGGPLERGLVTATVIGATATQAEVLTKVALSADAGEAASLLAPTGATGLLVDRQGRLHRLPGLDRFRVAEPVPTGQGRADV